MGLTPEQDAQLAERARKKRLEREAAAAAAAAAPTSPPAQPATPPSYTPTLTQPLAAYEPAFRKLEEAAAAAPPPPLPPPPAKEDAELRKQLGQTASAVRAAGPQPAEIYAGGFAPTKPFSGVIPSPVQAVFPPQTTSVFAPGAGATPEEQAEARRKSEEERAKYRQELREKGRLAAISTIPRPEFGVPKEAPALTETEIDQLVEQRFPKEQAVAQFVENPLSYGLRLITAPFNAIAGAIGGGVKAATLSPEAKTKMEAETGRTGFMGNIATNVSKGGGMFQELGDLAKYDPKFAPYETQLKTAGFLIDVLGAADMAPVTAAARAVKGVSAVKTAAKAGAAIPKVEAAARVGREAVAGYLDALPLVSKFAPKVQPGDVRLVYGARIGNDLAAAEDLIRGVDAATVAKKYPNSRVKTLDEANDAIASLPDAAKAAFVGKSDALRAVEQSGDAVLSKAQQAELAPYIRPTLLFGIADANSELGRINNKLLARLAKRDRGGERLSLDDVFKNINPEDLPTFLGAMRKTIAQDTGIQAVDEVAKTSLFPAAGTNLIAVTNNTLATPEGARAIEERLKQTPIGKVTAAINQKIAELASSGKKQTVPDLVDIPARFVNHIKTQIDTARISRSIDDRTAEALLAKLNATGKLDRRDVRQLVMAEADAIAKELTGEARIGLTARELGGVQPPKNILPREAQRIAQERRKEELTTDLPILLKRASVRLNDSISKSATASALTAEQNALLTTARNKVQNIDRAIQEEFNAIRTKPDVAKSYGVTPDATNAQILVAIGRGPVPLQDAAKPGWLREYADHVGKSLIYGTDRNAIFNAFSPAYKYGDVALAESGDYQKLIDSIADSAKEPALFLRNSSALFDDAAQVAKSNIDLERAAAGGLTKAVPVKLLDEVLVVSAVRAKAQRIINEVKVQGYREKEVSISDALKRLYAFTQEAPQYKITKEQITNLYYALLKEEFESQTRSPSNPRTWLSSVLDEAQEDLEYAKVVGEDAPESVGFSLIEEAAKTRLRPFVRATLTDVLGGDVEAAFTQYLITNWKKQGRFAKEGIGEDLRYASYLINDANPALVTDQMEQFIATLRLMNKGQIDANTFIDPAISTFIQNEIGKAPRFAELQQELARLADTANSAESPRAAKAALKASKAIRTLFELYNNFFYTMVLSVNPRFHGVNNLTAPFITAYTTGRWPVISTSAAKNYTEAINIAYLAKPNSTAVDRARVVVTDRLGNAYTRQDLYDATLKAGLFKSEVAAEIPRQMLEDIKTDIYGRSLLGKITSPIQNVIGTELATFTDNVHRLTSVIDAIESGKTFDEAVDIGRRSLYDYGNLTDAERVIARRVFVFYNFFRQSVAQFMRNLVTNPGPTIAMLRGTKDATEWAIGDQKAGELSFYYPPGFGTQRGGFVGEDGSLVALPMMPYQDGLNWTTLFLIDPYGALFGPKGAGQAPGGYGPAGRQFEQGLIRSKLGPISVLAGLQFFTPDTLGSVKTKKNQLAKEHVAFFKAMGPTSERMFLATFDAKVREAKQGEDPTYEDESGKWVVETTDDGFELYKKVLLVLQSTGAQRPFRDYTRMFMGPTAGWDRYLTETLGASTTLSFKPERDVAKRETGALGAVEFEAKKAAKE